MDSNHHRDHHRDHDPTVTTIPSCDGSAIGPSDRNARLKPLRQHQVGSGTAAMVEIVGVSRAQTTGAAMTKKGRKYYRGKAKHWYVYFYDDNGKFRKRKISQVQVPYYGSLIRRRKSYVCPSCGTKFRSLKDNCPKCGGKAKKLTRGSNLALPRDSGGLPEPTASANSGSQPPIS